MIVAQRFDAPKAPRREEIDFDVVLPHHGGIHGRLDNWARVMRVRTGARPATSPMFRLYRSTDAHADDAPPVRAPGDPGDALLVERAVRRLAEGPREALRWYYLFNEPAEKLAVYLRIKVDAIPGLIHQGRQSVSGLLAQESPSGL